MATQPCYPTSHQIAKESEMKPITKAFGFYLLLLTGTYLCVAVKDIGALFLIASLFYEAIKKDDQS
jgi:hypothetical protein